MSFPLALVVLAGLAIEEPPPAPVAVDRLDQDDTFAFDWTGVDTGGAPVVVDRTVYRLRTALGDRIAVAIPGEVLAGTTEHRVADVLASAPVGRYTLDVQLRSAAGLWGAFSESLEIDVTEGTPPPGGRSPARPTALRKVERP